MVPKVHTFQELVQLQSLFIRFASTDAVEKLVALFVTGAIKEEAEAQGNFSNKAPIGGVFYIANYTKAFQEKLVAALNTAFQETAIVRVLCTPNSTQPCTETLLQWYSGDGVPLALINILEDPEDEYGETIAVITYCFTGSCGYNNSMSTPSTETSI